MCATSTRRPSSCPIYDCVVWPEAAREDGKDDEEARVKVCIGVPHGNKGKKDWVKHCCTEASIITRQLSHIAKIDELYYQAIVGEK